MPLVEFANFLACFWLNSPYRFGRGGLQAKKSKSSFYHESFQNRSYYMEFEFWELLNLF